MVGLIKKTSYKNGQPIIQFVKKTKLTELENKFLDVSSLAANTALTAVENKIPSVSSLVKKTDYDTKISELEKKLTDHNHDKYITTPEFNTLAADVFNARLAQANLITKTDFDAKLSSLNRNITANKSNNLLVENELKKLKTFDLSYFIGKSHFEEDGTQNYLVFQPMYRYFKMITNTDYVSSWKSKGLSAESIKPPTTSDNSLTPALNYYGTKARIKFLGNVYNNLKFPILMESNIKNSLLGAVTLTKNAGFDKYGYSGYGIGFDRKSTISFPDGGFGQNVIIFGVDMSCSVDMSWFNARIRTYINCRRNVFNQFYCDKKEILFKLV